MRVLDAQLDLEAFFARLRQARRGALLVDYDGTLAPHTPDREQAVPYAGVREALERLAEKTRVVIVSGRPVSAVARLLAPKRPLEIWGVHGLERCLPDGRYTAVALEEADARLLERAAAWLGERGWTQHAERKPGSLALHWRGLPPEQAARMRSEAEARWTRLACGSGLAVEEFDSGLELRAAARSKADAVRAVLAETEAGVPAAYLGDDRTDEDAFRALAGRGLRVLVRPEFRETAADLWLEPPRELLHFLERWRTAVEGGA